MACTLGDDIQSQRSAILIKSNIYKVWKPPEHAPTLWKIGENLSQYLHSSLTFEAHHTTKKAKSKPRCGGGIVEVLTSPADLWFLFIGKTND
jgi:hypothetical protein